jgi:hypothetical protein
VSVAEPVELGRAADEVRAVGSAGDDAEPQPPPLHADIVDAAEQLAEGNLDASALALLTAEEVGDVFALGFALVADRRGPHWELDKKSAGRIGKWVKRSLERHGAAWLEKWLPEVMAGMMLAYELGVRLREDQRLKREGGERALPT